MQKVYLKNSARYAVVGDADYEKVHRFAWYLMYDKDTDMYYAFREMPTTTGKETRQLMHRLILGLKNGDPRVVEHKDDDGLNNRRDNLEIVTRTQNQTSRVVSKNSKSGFKGVCEVKVSRRWYGHITLHYQTYYLGTYRSKYHCAEARNYAATIVHGGRGRHIVIPPSRRPGPRSTKRIHRNVDDELKRQGFIVPEQTVIAEPPGRQQEIDASSKPTDQGLKKPSGDGDVRESSTSAA